MTGKELKKLVPKWAAKVGVRTARLELQRAGFGFSTADQLIKGVYKSTPVGESVDKLKLALNGFIKKAS